jgi:hypothetical protein
MGKAKCHHYRVQQDGAPSHINPQDPSLLQGLQQLGIHSKVQLYTRPSNSSDTCINDLCFLCALQSEYYTITPGNAGQIIQCVQQAYNAYDKHKINRIWLSLMGCLNEIIEHHGNNDYQISHMGKDRLIRLNLLPIAIPVCNLGVELCDGLVDYGKTFAGVWNALWLKSCSSKAVVQKVYKSKVYSSKCVGQKV